MALAVTTLYQTKAKGKERKENIFTIGPIYRVVCFLVIDLLVPHPLLCIGGQFLLPVITRRQFGIDYYLQCVFQDLTYR
jgi:hypothetical protein